MNRLLQKLSFTALIFLVFTISSIAQSTLPKVETDAVLVMTDGTERAVIMRMTSANYNQPVYQVHDLGEKKFKKLNTKDVEKIILNTRDGEQHILLLFPTVLPKGRKKSQVSDGKVMVLLKWQGENCVAGFAGMYYLRPKDGSLVTKYDPTFGTMLIFRDLRNEKGVMLGYTNPRKNEGDVLKMNNMAKMMLAPYNVYFEEVCSKFLEEYPCTFENEFNIQEFMENYEATCSN